MNHFLITIILYTLTLALSAQTGTIKGKITFLAVPVEGAQVQLLKTGLGAVSDKDGTYLIEQVPIGKYTIKANMIGYKPVDREILIAPGSVIQVDFLLDEDILNLNQVVVSGTRTDLPQFLSPIIVSTVSKRTFEITQSLSLSEGLNFTPGLRLENNCQNCGFTQLRMNGLGGAYSQILINSRPIFSSLAGVYGLELIPASIVDRIEVVRGGGSAIYGGNAIAGTVNVITKDPIRNAFEIGFNQAYTNLETPDFSLNMNGALVSESGKLGLSFYGYNRSRDPWDANDDGFSEMTQMRNHTFGFDAFWNTSNRSKLKLGFFSINEFRRGGNGFDRMPHQSDLTEQLDHQFKNASISFEHYSKNFKHKYAVYASGLTIHRGSYFGSGGRIIGPKDTLTPADIIALNAYGKSEDRTLVGGIQYVYDITKSWLITAGTEYQYNSVSDQIPAYNRMVNQKVATLGNYFQVQIIPLSRMTLLLGGRFDFVKVDGHYRLQAETFNERQNMPVFVPRLSLMYAINSKLKARVSFAQGYRAPQAYNEDLHIETVGGSPRFIRLSPDLKPESSNSGNVSLSYDQDFNGKEIKLVAEYFYTQLLNPYILSGQMELPGGITALTKRNSSGAIVQGLNIEASFAYSRKLILQSGATFQTARYVKEELIWAPQDSNDFTPSTRTNHILRTPNAYGYATLMYLPNEALSLSYSGVYTGSMPVPHSINPETQHTIIKNTPTFFEHNIKIAYSFKFEEAFKFQVYCGIQNMLNSYQQDFDSGITRDAAYIYGPNRPRTLYFGAKLNLN